MTFGQALEHVKAGGAVSRPGWSGRGMHISAWPGSIDHANHPGKNGRGPHQIPGHLFELGDNGTTTRLPCVKLRTPSGENVLGWLASQTDLFAEDWEILEDGPGSV